MQKKKKKSLRLPYKIRALMMKVYKASLNPISPGNKGLRCEPSVFTLPLDTGMETFNSTVSHTLKRD